MTTPGRECWPGNQSGRTPVAALGAGAVSATAPRLAGRRAAAGMATSRFFNTLNALKQGGSRHDRDGAPAASAGRSTAQMRQQMGGPNPNPRPPPPQISAPLRRRRFILPIRKQAWSSAGAAAAFPQLRTSADNGTYMPPGGSIEDWRGMPPHGIGPGTPMGPMPSDAAQAYPPTR